MNKRWHCRNNLRQVSGEELGHTEGADAVGTEDLGHLLVGGEELLVLGVLEVVLLEVGPQELDAFSAAGLLLANDVSEVGGELHGLGKSGSFGHLYKFGLVLVLVGLSLTLCVQKMRG